MTTLLLLALICPAGPPVHDHPGMIRLNFQRVVRCAYQQWGAREWKYFYEAGSGVTDTYGSNLCATANPLDALEAWACGVGNRRDHGAGRWRTTDGREMFQLQCKIPVINQAHLICEVTP